jgi:hypothetical protein
MFRAMPSQGHGVLSTEYGKRRLEDFFESMLGGVKWNSSRLPI